MNENEEILISNNENQFRDNAERKVSITTIDNPFNPITDFDKWFLYDIEKGYYTSSKLARLTNLVEGMSQKEEDEEVERAINRLIELDPLNIYKKVVINDKNDQQKTID